MDTKNAESNKSEVRRASLTVVGVLTRKDTSSKDLPATLYVGLQGHTEWIIGRQHAWGTAFASTDPSGANRYPVERIELIITMEDQNKEQHADNAPSVDNDVHKDGAVGGAPHGLMVAAAHHSAYNPPTWSTNWRY